MSEQPPLPPTPPAGGSARPRKGLVTREERSPSDSHQSWWKVSIPGVLWVLVPLALGVLIAWQMIPHPVVGVLRIDRDISPATTPNILRQIAYVRDQSRIQALVVVLNSPGGTVPETEAIYLELLHLRETHPVVVVVEGMAASGAYYLATAGDHVYVQPSSRVGNIGVISFLPPEPLVLENVVWTGPHKIFGTSRDSMMRSAEVIKRQFYTVVQTGRGDKLNTDQETLLSGSLWTGTTALEMGLADEIGNVSQAVARAADKAKIANYQIVNLKDELGIEEYFLYYSLDGLGQSSHMPITPGIYMRYFAPEERRLP